MADDATDSEWTGAAPGEPETADDWRDDADDETFLQAYKFHILGVAVVWFLLGVPRLDPTPGALIGAGMASVFVGAVLVAVVVRVRRLVA